MRRNPHPVAISKSASVSHRQTRTTALGNIPYFHKVPFLLLGCSQLPGPRTVPVRSAPGSARMPGKPRCRGMVGAAANRDDSRSDPELDAAVFTMLPAGWADGRSALVRACPSRMTDNTTIAALHQEKMRLLGNGSLTAGEGFGGVRPSSGAATTEKSGAPDSITSPSLSNIAAPGDGRTPKTSPPPSLTHYPSGGGGGGATHRQSSGLFIPLPPCRSTCV
jgi:hypothetical protein